MGEIEFASIARCSCCLSLLCSPSIISFSSPPPAPPPSTAPPSSSPPPPATSLQRVKYLSPTPTIFCLKANCQTSVKTKRCRQEEIQVRVGELKECWDARGPQEEIARSPVRSQEPELLPGQEGEGKSFQCSTITSKPGMILALTHMTWLWLWRWFVGLTNCPSD